MLKLNSQKGVIMEWVQFLILFITMVGFILTQRADMRAFEKDSKEWRERYDKETKEFRERSDKNMQEFREKWAEESKDFHGRLIAIEERRNKFIFKD